MDFRLKDEHARTLRESVADDAKNILVGESEQNGGRVEGDDIDNSTEEGGMEEAGVPPVSPCSWRSCRVGFQGGWKALISCVLVYIYTHIQAYRGVGNS